MAHLKSIRTPIRRARISPSQREPLGDPGPNCFQQMRRAELLGESVVCILGTGEVRITGTHSQSATSSSLNLLYDSDKITQPQYRAGLMYASMRRILFGRAVPRGSQLSKIMAESIFDSLSKGAMVRKGEIMTDEDRDEWLEALRLRYYQGDNRLRKIHYARRVREILRRVLIDDMMPEPKRPNQLARLREGLQEIADCWRTDK